MIQALLRQWLKELVREAIREEVEAQRADADRQMAEAVAKSTALWAAIRRSAEPPADPKSVS